jgi:putative cardiolipin synthase
LHPGTSRVVADVPAAGVIRQDMVEAMYQFAESATREILVLNAYIIPREPTMHKLRNLLDRGVSVKVVTNSLASRDGPAVNSHYKRWRKAILQAGAEWYEMRHDAAIQPLVSDTPPTRAKFMGLHSKAMVIDRKRVYIGSMNFDPRSAAINTEETQRRCM